MTGNFNIRDSIWDPSFPHYSFISDNLMIIADSLNLELSILTNQVPTRYLDTVSEANSVINLMFLRSGSNKLNNHSIHPEWWLSSDYASIIVSISIAEENIIISKFSIAKNSKEEENFIKDVLSIIKSIEVSDLSDIDKLKDTTNSLASSIENVWRSNSKQVNITRHSKSWWNNKCNLALSNYRLTRSLEDWKLFKNKVKSSKRSFFDLKIQEIANKKREPWELMNWVNKRKIPAIKAIKHNRQQCHNIDDLWNTLHSTINTALHRQVDVEVLDEVINKLTSYWAPFSKEEFRITIANCNNTLTSGPDKLS